MPSGLADIGETFVPHSRARGAKDRDRRKSSRWTYECVQRIAVFDGVNLPPIESFHLVRCMDLSTSGMSYYSLTKPDYRQVVLALSDFERTLYVIASVRHWRAGFWMRRQQFLVGCQFERRVRYIS